MFVFHAGPHKTGSTYVQDNFKRARAELDARGWLYPVQGCGPYAGHQEIGHADPGWLAEGGAGRETLAPVARAAAQGKHVVMSTEGAARWGPERYHAVADALGLETIDVVHALRDPIERLYSFWIEQVKQGLPQSFGDRAAEHLADPLGSDILNPLQTLEPLLADPRIRLHAIPYEVLRSRKIDLYSHLCAAVLGLDGIEPPRDTPSNIALPIFLTEFLRLMTLSVLGQERRIDSKMRLRFFAETNGQERRDLALLLRDRGKPARRRIHFPERVFFKAELETALRDRLAGHWTLDPGETPLYPPGPHDYIYYDAFVLMQDPDVAAAVLTQVARFCPDAPRPAVTEPAEG